ncbi:putative damage-inducible protein DinB [Oikeobacillus pervagus]|uniref:Damage-inducible protein DinB n=1 Tax=Oikeobacillus pervagus TaxID=1325931 RepID=A0AAJ1T7N7_9BACI|nr:DinB family protein [Oikeobacillus pervagus]MDQ0216080.1 putative damage-inducible protein DinB [Oikeobacillus pervagus]
MFPKLDEIRKNLLKSVECLSDEALNKKVDEEKWSISQILYHLYEVENLAVSTLESGLEHGDEQVVERDLQFVVDRSRKVKLPDDPPNDFKTKDELKALLEKSRKNLHAFLEKTDMQTLKEKSAAHLVFGKISLKNMVEFVYLHEQRHLEQIEEMKEELNYGLYK